MTPWFGNKNPESGSSRWPSPASRAGRAGEPMKVSELIDERTILIAREGQDKNALLKALVARLCEAKGLADKDVLLAKVLEREQGISTTLDSGLSLPHARIDGFAGIVAAMGLAPQGIRESKQQELVIRVMFVFFSPNKPEAFPLHLQLLRGVSALLQPPLIDELCRASSEAEALKLLRSREG